MKFATLSILKNRMTRSLLLIATSLLFTACSDAEPDVEPAKQGNQTLSLPSLPSDKQSHDNKPTLDLAKTVPVKIVTPKHLASIPTFKDYPAGQARKDAFFKFVAPLIQQANQQILADRTRVQEITNHFKISDADQAWLKALALEYRLKKFNPMDATDQRALEKRVDVIPASLALAQAANESAWGTSRFARKANNYFGQWCFSKGCGLVPARRNKGSNHEVRSFKHPFYSVQSYLKNLNSHPSYQKLRTIRAKARSKNKMPSGIAMAEGLVNYSERKHEYVSELQSMIRYNKLTQFDHK